jgi:hypothetical protein
MAAPRRPDPEPLPTSDLTVVSLGTLVWALALLVALVLRGRLEEQGRGGWVWVAAAGAGLGLVGIRHLRRRRSAELQGEDPSEDPTGPNPT